MDLESICTKLAKEGYHAGLSRRAAKWHCALYSSHIVGVPQGEGNTALDAVNTAIKDRDALIAEGRSTGK